MAASPLTETCSCANPSITILDEKLREQLELRLLAKLEEFMDRSPPTSFFLLSKLGSFIWGCFTALVMNVVWLLLTKSVEIFNFSSAAQQICSYMGLKGLRPVGAHPSDVDKTEAAEALASPRVSEATATDTTARQKEVSLRQMLKNIWLKPLFRTRREGDTLPVTNCEDLQTANSTQAASGSLMHQSCNTAPSSTPSYPSTSNVAFPIGVHLPNTTVEAEQMADFQIHAANYLPPHTEGYTVESGSTFLSATVQIAASAMDDLLQCAECLLKMGCGYDPACVVQLGNNAILYKTTTGENVEKKLLEGGVHDIPIITSARKFKDRTIVIKGSYLEDTDIKATTPTYGQSTHLHVIYHKKLEKGLELLLAQLPNDQPFHEKIDVHAIKSIQMEGCPHPLVLRSKSKEIDISQQNSSIFGPLRTARFWICFLGVCIYQATRVRPLRWLLVEGLFGVIIFFLSYFLVECIISPWILKMIIYWIAMKAPSKNLHHVSEPKNQPTRNVSINRRSLNTRQDEASLLPPFLFERLRRRTGEDGDDDVSPFSTESTTEPNVPEQEGPVNNLTWEWPCYERFLRGGRWVIERASAAKTRAEETIKWPFEVITTVDPDGSETVRLIVCSPLLIQVLSECDPKTGIQFTEGSKKSPTEIFLRREGLKSYVARNSHQMDDSAAASGEHVSEAQIGVWYVKHLLRFMERHFAELLVQYERMKAEGCVSFEMLWAFFVPGEGVRRLCLITNQECFAIIKAAKYDQREGFVLTLIVMDFNVQSYRRCTMKYTIAPFEGEVPFTSLQVCPLQFFSNRKDMEARFISMGNIFYQLAMQQPFCFMQFKGSMNFFQSDGGCLRLRKLNADGRVMVDLLSFARMNPDYPLQNAEPPCEVMTGMWTREEPMKKPTDEELMLAPAFAYGFSFRLKKWGCFELCGLREISFNEHAFDALKMKNEGQKMILWSVVQQYMVSRGGSRMQIDRSIDPIGSKGTGCIVLCHGPPGTGKTLTAEALAETLRSPLWSISAFELGAEPDEVEATLSRIMEIAYIWGAILLLDEADAYLEKRGEGVDVKRNLLTGVFLRVLEYYRGIMFLTTNRVTAFDDAILSRTTLALSYPALDDTQRREIWKELLNCAGIRDATYDALLHQDLNGRQIRNIVHLAQLLAHGSKQTLDITHVLNAMDAFIAGTNDLPKREASS